MFHSTVIYQESELPAFAPQHLMHLETERPLCLYFSVLRALDVV